LLSSPLLLRERLFGARSNHERTFAVKQFFEQPFALAVRAAAEPTRVTPYERVFAIEAVDWYVRHERTFEEAIVAELTDRQREVLEIIEQCQRERGYPPSVREIGEAIGLTSTSTVHAHLSTLQRLGYLRRDPTKPRAIEVRWVPGAEAAVERRPARHVPLVGDVAAGVDVLAEQNVEDSYPIPADFCGEGELFMLRVRGDSMIDAGILDGDFVVVQQLPAPEKGDIVVAGIPGEEATVKTYTRKGGKVILLPANSRLKPMEYDPAEVQIFGKVVTVLRRL
jgi:repressor LexA